MGDEGGGKWGRHCATQGNPKNRIEFSDVADGREKGEGIVAKEISNGRPRGSAASKLEPIRIVRRRRPGNGIKMHREGQVRKSGKEPKKVNWGIRGKGLDAVKVGFEGLAVESNSKSFIPFRKARSIGAGRSNHKPRRAGRKTGGRVGGKATLFGGKGESGLGRKTSARDLKKSGATPTKL